MDNKYFNDAIIGNKNVKATFSKKGELLRLYYPNIDFRQFIDKFIVGVKINDSRFINLADDINNIYSQKYIESTNILQTEILNTYFNLNIEQIDFIPIKENILIKKYKFINNNTVDLEINLILFSTLLSSNNNNVSGIYKNGVLTQYMHDYNLSIFSNHDLPPLSYQINNTSNNINEGYIEGKDYVGTSNNSSISYNIKTLKPGEETELEIIISIQECTKSFEEYEKEIIRLGKIDTHKLLENTKKYWRNYLKEHSKIDLGEIINFRDKQIKKIYERTILLFPLLYNYETGGIAAAAEVDENYTKCGRYSYCWPRDAIFITKAMLKLGMVKEVEKFYKIFCNSTQSKNGMWEQRFYTDGKLAPSWGYQIDETASVIYGVYECYLYTNNVKFLKDNLKMCEKASVYLEKYIDSIFNNEKIQLSYDIWEECEAIHTYSLATIFSALRIMKEINNLIKPFYTENRLKLEQINKQEQKINDYLIKIKKYILENLCDKDKKCLLRNNIDKKVDISLLGVVTPFELFTTKEKIVENTIEKINLTLRTYTGGYLRYEGDNYIGGNPWIISNLWLAEYYLKAGMKNKARECFDFVLKSSNIHGFLPEQVDNNTMDSAWVIGLGWSHAMFINVLEQLL